MIGSRSGECVDIFFAVVGPFLSRTVKLKAFLADGLFWFCLMSITRFNYKGMFLHPCRLYGRTCQPLRDSCLFVKNYHLCV